MKKVKFRASFALLIAAALLAGLSLYVARFVRDGADWAAFPPTTPYTKTVF